MRSQRRGLTIPEILVTAFLLLALTQLLVVSLVVLHRSQAGLTARTEPRQQLRSFVLLLQNELQEAAYLFGAATYPVWGVNLEVPGATEGNGLVFAVPENAAGPMTYRVCYAFSRPRSQPDPLNPGAYEAVFYTVTGAAPVGGLPSALDPAALSASGNVEGLHVFDAYLDGPDGLKTELLADGLGAKFEVSYKRTPERGETTHHQLESTIVARNIP